MATVTKWTPFGVALNVTATGSTVKRTSATKFTVVIKASWETYWDGSQTNYGMTASSGGSSATINKFGTKASSGSGSFTGTYSISGNGSATKTVTVTFKNFNTDNGDSATKTVSFSVSVPAWTSYTIKYNANGGSGAPANQTKWKDQTLTLSSTKPTRTGYSFLGWSTSSTATSATYSAGGNYTANSAATLYAVWKANTYTIKYNANGGSGAPGNQTKTYGKTLTLSTTKPTRTNYNFLGWATSASATKATYSAGGSYTANSAATLYAVWELAYVKPRITNFSVTRCDSEGTSSDEGEYARINFNWACDQEVSSVVINWATSETGDEAGSKTITTSDQNGSIDELIDTATFSTDKTYKFTVTVTDGGGTNTSSKIMNSIFFVVDFKAGGTGIAFGKAAELDNALDVALNSRWRNPLYIHNNKILYGIDPNGGGAVDALNPQNASGNTVLGYGNYERKSGNTNIYGHDINFRISNVGNSYVFKPYIRQGDSIGVDIRTAGYVTNSKKDISFIVPLSAPIIGKPTVTVSSLNGFILRQGDSYTHGSTASVYVIPDSYSAKYHDYVGVYITAKFSDTTNVTNNDAIGIYWNGTITFS